LGFEHLPQNLGQAQKAVHQEISEELHKYQEIFLKSARLWECFRNDEYALDSQCETRRQTS